MFRRFRLKQDRRIWTSRSWCELGRFLGGDLLTPGRVVLRISWCRIPLVCPGGCFRLQVVLSPDYAGAECRATSLSKSEWG